MAEATGQERSEKATGKRRMEARRKRASGHQPEIPSTLILFTLLGVFVFAAAWMHQQMIRIVRVCRPGPRPLRLTCSVYRRQACSTSPNLSCCCCRSLPPWLVAGVVGNVVQVGFLVIHRGLVTQSSQAEPDAPGLKRIFSLRGLVELAKSLSENPVRRCASPAP